MTELKLTTDTATDDFIYTVRDLLPMIDGAVVGEFVTLQGDPPPDWHRFCCTFRIKLQAMHNGQVMEGMSDPTRFKVPGETYAEAFANARRMLPDEVVKFQRKLTGPKLAVPSGFSGKPV